MKTPWTKNALEVLSKRYLHHGKTRQETPDEMLRRVAKAVGRGQMTLEKRFLASLQALEFLPNSPTLMNAGLKNGQLAACFVLPVPDDLVGIMDALKYTALIHQSGGGTGFSFSQLRPTNAPVKSSHGVAAGPLGFLHLFNELTQVIKQGGLRRGANMGVLAIDHPDIEEFIKIKQDSSKITNFNLSVAVTDKFMDAVKKNSDWELKDPHSRKTVRKIQARTLFNLICESAWKTGEPGLIFIDEVNRYNPTPKIGRIEATNPCGEQPLLPYEACNLGSINLNALFAGTTHSEDNRSWKEKISWAKLEDLAETGVLFLDSTIDVCHYPIPEITEMCRAHRKIGLGVMGFADLLLKLGIRYGSEESFQVANEVMERIRLTALDVSQTLARKKGPFKGYAQSLWKKKGVKPLRNATLTTVAPTGTISLLANASAGIEPIFSYAYERNVLDGAKLWEVHPALSELIQKHDLDLNAVVQHAGLKGTLKGLDLPREVLDVFVTVRDLTTDEHVKMQSVFQKHSDSAVSKTINLSFSAEVSDVVRAYEMAHELGCKGITVYRDRSRPDQVLQLKDCEDCSRIGA